MLNFPSKYFNINKQEPFYKLMANNYIFKMLHIASEIAVLGDPERTYRLGAIAKRSDGALVYAFNGRPINKEATSHAEFRLSKKLDSADTVFVARVGNYVAMDNIGYYGLMRLAKPCESCQMALRSKRVKRVIYSISNEEYGVLYL